MMAQKDELGASTSTSQDKSSDDFFTPPSELGSCTDGDAHEDVYQRSLSSDPGLPYPMVYLNSKAEIEASKVHWTPRADVEMEAVETETETLEVFRSLQKEWGGFFMEFDDQFKMGPKIAEGGQAEIFAVVSGCKLNMDSVVKLFKKGASLRHLQHQWPTGMLQSFSSKHGGPSFNHYSVNLHGAMLLGGRFAFLMQRYWGDLRTLIDIKMRNNPVQLGQIFTDSRVFHNMLEIADGMRDLHKAGILHRDLKASNVLIRPFESRFDPISGYFLCKVADYECSVGVVGTGFWRAPEILHCLSNSKSDRSNLCTQKSDVYSYGMTCYEILTGKMPFGDSPRSDYGFVCSGGRPELPSNIKPWIKKLLHNCWHQDPSKRPCFQEIIDYLCKHHKLDTHVQQT